MQMIKPNIHTWYIKKIYFPLLREGKEQRKKRRKGENNRSYAYLYVYIHMCVYRVPYILVHQKSILILS